jgi:hypothetical protein
MQLACAPAPLARTPARVLSSAASEPTGGEVAALVTSMARHLVASSALLEGRRSRQAVLLCGTGCFFAGNPSENRLDSLSQYLVMARVCGDLAVRLDALRPAQQAWGNRVRERWVAEQQAWASCTPLAALQGGDDEALVPAAAAAPTPPRAWLQISLTSAEPPPALAGLNALEAALDGGRRFLASRRADLAAAVGSAGFKEMSLSVQVMTAEGLAAVTEGYSFCSAAAALLARTRAEHSLDAFCDTGDALLRAYADYVRSVADAYVKRHAWTTELLGAGVVPLPAQLCYTGSAVSEIITPSIESIDFV